MRATGARTSLRAALLLTAAASISSCTTTDKTASAEHKPAPTKIALNQNLAGKQVYTYTAKDRECLKRAMYFESQRSSEKGFLAVGSVIMNRLTSGMYPETICGVVAQKNQFAPGVMTRRMDEDTAPDLNQAADEVLKGARHPDVKEAMFFHRQGMRFPYDNMHYTAAAGGNVFYEKRDENGALETATPKPANEYVMAYAQTDQPPSSIDLLMPGSPEAKVAQANHTITAPLGMEPGSESQASSTVAQNAAPQSASGQAAAVQVAMASAPARPSVAAQPVAPAPVITAAIAKASVEQGYDTAYAVPQNSSVSEARLYPTAFTTDVPVPVQRPKLAKIDSQKRQGAGMAMASVPQGQDGITYNNWAMRTGSW